MKKYYYLNSAQQQMGPVYADEFPRLGLTGETFVWCEGMPNWVKANQVPEILPYLNGHSPVYGGGASYGNANGAAPSKPQPPCPDNYLVWSILSTVFCCWPIGIVAIIKSAKVNNLWTQGYYEQAQNTANEAKKWCIVSAVSAIAFMIIYFVFVVALGAAGAL
ncbi:MAG: CD225/dispanin family protein [Bacteroidaceae bacterium]|nr:CD225/dispanin family protein [Bacteroidaceae bacterium]